MIAREQVWHAAYSRWYDHMDAGHTIRAWVWARITDALALTFWGTR